MHYMSLESLKKHLQKWNYSRMTLLLAHNRLMFKTPWTLCTESMTLLNTTQNYISTHTGFKIM